MDKSSPSHSRARAATADDSLTEVIKCEGGNEHHLKSYILKEGPNIGDAYIFSNDEFIAADTKVKKRDGNAIDLQELEKLLPEMGFSGFTTHLNLKISEFGQKLEEISKKYKKEKSDPNEKNVNENENSRPSCFLMIFLSHGNLDEIEMTDSCYSAAMPILKIINMFGENHCEYLREVPKIFIFQVCRGKKANRGVEIQKQKVKQKVDEKEEKEQKNRLIHSQPEGDESCGSSIDGCSDDEDFEEDVDCSKSVFIPIGTDVMCCYPTLPGYIASRNRTTGSRFIQALVKVIKDYIHDTESTSQIDFASLMTLVSANVAHITTRSKGEVKKQMPWYSSTFRKKLYFRKKAAGSCSSEQDLNHMTPPTDDAAGEIPSTRDS